MDSNCQIISIGAVDSETEQVSSAFDPSKLPILATRNLVLFPFVTIPISLVRPSSASLVKEMNDNKQVFGICCQLDSSEKEVSSLDRVSSYGVAARVVQILSLPNGEETALVQGLGRFKILEDAGSISEGNETERRLYANVKPLTDQLSTAPDREFATLISHIHESVGKLAKMSTIDPGLAFSAENINDPATLVNILSTNLDFPIPEKIKMLAVNSVKKRAKMLFAQTELLLEKANIMEELRSHASEEMNRQMRANFLQTQMNLIREELYGSEEEDVDRFRKTLEMLELPENARLTIKREIDKLARINPSSPDYAVSLSYLETVLDLPWNISSEPNTDFIKAEEILEADHYGLEKVKERILEQLALVLHNPTGKSPIICLVGPPGVGKTSLGQSVAKALGRNYQRVALGGAHDESEIRGHRRTYIGAMPGRIMDAVKRAGTNNPVILLDEIDKIGNDIKGNPSGALLEVLDPEQNCKFHDNYIDIDFDLSNVVFIATANTLSTIDRPLLDRMEIIDLTGYLAEEKLEIALRHLIPRLRKEQNLTEEDIEIPRETIAEIISRYTSESGVRQLHKRLATIMRKSLLARMRQKPLQRTITPDMLGELLGVPGSKPDTYLTDPIPGVATGLAWTAVGGEILFIETSISKGKESRLTLTGNLGDVMKESATIALQYVKANAESLGIDPEKFENSAFHIHVPEGAVPKDGPSAGITIATSIGSALIDRPVKSRLAMTGEITLRGKVLPVGGIKEKILAAKRAGITELILSPENRKDVEDIPAKYIDGLQFHYLPSVTEVLNIAIPR